MKVRSVVTAAGLALGAAACSSDNGADTRCQGAAQVPAWDVAWTVAFSDTGTAHDTFPIMLHHDVNGTGTTGPAAARTDADGVAWFMLTPGGTIDVHDTVIDPVNHDTTVGVVALLTPHRHGDGSFSGGYVAVDLAHCTADVGALFYGEMHRTIDGVNPTVDTLQIGYSLVQDLPLDSAAVQGGWTVPAQKVATRAGVQDFQHQRQYLALSLSGRYAPGVDVDSATISFTVTPHTP